MVRLVSVDRHAMLLSCGLPRPPPRRPVAARTDHPPPVVSAGFRQRSMKAQGVGLVCPAVAHDDSMEPISRTAIIKAAYVRISLRHSLLYSWRRNDVSLDNRGPR